MRVFRTPDAMTASLFADQYCGDGTRVIYYVRPKSVTSRPFTSKDTHSPAGDLLVVYSDPKSHHHDVDLAQLTTSVLGFEAPLFTLSTDLMLPAGANHDLRELLTSEADGNDDKHDDTGRTTLEDLARFNDTSAIPQVTIDYTTCPLREHVRLSKSQWHRIMPFCPSKKWAATPYHATEHNPRV